uniref:Uncharacterized protein n=1 Tax=Aegilops tauschii subsp. strangulata TaxID=200361 RepID=A0A453AY95_AEGTS
RLGFNRAARRCSSLHQEAIGHGDPGARAPSQARAAPG